MIHVSGYGLIVVAVFVLPPIALMLLGMFWLWQQGVLLPVALVFTVVIAVTWLGLRHLYRKNIKVLQHTADIQAHPFWADNSLSAWEQAQAIADSLRLADYPLDEPMKLLALGQSTIERVAQHFHPGSKNALLEVSIPHLLLINELVSRDLRQLLDTIPFTHMLTLHDLKRGHGMRDFIAKCYDAYRLGSLALDPVGALLREMRTLAGTNILRYPTDELKLWLLRSYIKKVAYYAIELYSGNLTLSDVKTQDYLTRYSQQTLATEPSPSTSEPLRLLIVGQTKSGKSSLINALFGEMRAATDVLPLTAEMTPYVLERPEAGQLIVIDSTGYAGIETRTNEDKVEDQFLRCDLVILVCSIVNAARLADRQFLEKFDKLFASHPELAKPVILVALTHIDRLRPIREWEPPYDIATPDNTKAANIRSAMEAVAKDLDVDLANIIPVNLNPGHLYNVDEGIIPSILANIDSAKRSRYLRCLREQQREDHWMRLREQAVNLGKFVLKAGMQYLQKR